MLPGIVGDVGAQVAVIPIDKSHAVSAVVVTLVTI